MDWPADKDRAGTSRTPVPAPSLPPCLCCPILPFLEGTQPGFSHRAGANLLQTYLSPNAPPASCLERPSSKLHQHPCTQRCALRWAFTGGWWGQLGLDVSTPPLRVHPEAEPAPNGSRAASQPRRLTSGPSVSKGFSLGLAQQLPPMEQMCPARKIPPIWSWTYI